MINTEKRNKIIANIALAVTVVAWGAGFLLNKIALNAGAGPAFINSVRFVTATVLVGAVFCRRIRPDKHALLFGAVCGALLFAGFLLQLIGLDYSTPAYNGFFTTSYFAVVPFLTWLLTKKRPTALTLCGIAVALIGYAVLNFGGGAPSASQNGTLWLGNLLTLAAALCFAVQIALTDYALRSERFQTDPLSLTFWQIAFAALLFVLYFLLFELPKTDFAAFNWQMLAFPLLFVSVLGTAFAYPAQIWSQGQLPASTVSLILSFESVIGSVISFLYGTDEFSLHFAIGAALVLSALFIVQILPEIKKK